MSAVAQRAVTPPVSKDLYEIGEIPPLGHVPERMHAWVIRKERLGPPEQSMQVEVVPTWPIRDDEVLVHVMAGGVNYNGIWAALGQPVSVLDVHKHPFHIAGSDAAGVVWAAGAKVKRWKVGDEVIVHCNQDDGDDEECNGGDPMLSPSQRIWGYETPDGSFAQFCRVQSRQLMVKPKHLDLGGSGLLHADAGDRLSDAVRPSAAYAQARRQRAGLGRERGLGGLRGAARRRLRGQRHRHHLGRDQARLCARARRQGRDQPQGIQVLGPAAAGQLGPVQRMGRRRRAVSARRSGTSPTSTTSISCSSTRASRPSRSPAWW